MSDGASVPLDPLANKIAQSLEPTPQGLSLAEHQYEHWIDALAKYPKKDTACLHLMVLAKRLLNEGEMGASIFLVGIVMGVLEHREALAAMEAAGLEAAQARALVKKAEMGAPGLNKGLAPPAGGVRTGKRR